MSDKIELFDEVEVPSDVNIEKVSAIRGDIKEWIAKAQALTVVTEEDYKRCEEIGSECQRRIKAVESDFAESREAADRAHKAITRLIASLTNPYKEVKAVIAQKARQWFNSEQEKRRVAAEIARRAEQKRIDDERLAAAEKAKAAGDDVVAERIMDTEVIVAPVREVAMPQSSGMSHKQNWQVDELPGGFMLLVKAVAEGRAGANLLLPNEQALRAMAKGLKGAFNVPGYKAYDAGSTAFRA